jgi:hypothetical protein
MQCSLSPATRTARDHSVTPEPIPNTTKAQQAPRSSQEHSIQERSTQERHLRTRQRHKHIDQRHDDTHPPHWDTHTPAPQLHTRQETGTGPRTVVDEAPHTLAHGRHRQHLDGVLEALAQHMRRQQVHQCKCRPEQKRRAFEKETLPHTRHGAARQALYEQRLRMREREGERERETHTHTHTRTHTHTQNRNQHNVA